MRVLAVSSGTSVDAIDVARAELNPLGDGALQLVLCGHLEVPWPQALHDRLLAALPPGRPGVGEWCALEAESGRGLGAAVAEGLPELVPANLVTCQGQRLYQEGRRGRAH